MLLLGAVTGACASPAPAAVVPVGGGGYLTSIPTPCKPLPETIHKTADLRGPTPTGQWWSSLVWRPYSQPMFAHPLALRCTENGLAVSYPGARITANKAGIFGLGLGKNGDLIIGHSAAPTFPKADCAGFSDWFVTAAFTSGPASLQASFGHGSPFVFCRISGGNPTVRFATQPQIWSGTARDAVLGITVSGDHYGLFGASGSTWRGLDSTQFLNDAQGQQYFSLALLPDNTTETLTFFRQYAYSHVTDTRLEFDTESGMVKATYQFATTPQEGTNTSTIFALYPHQWKYASGDANFGDGNNQESSSESMNAWYGLILWGMATGNPTLRDTGICLFNTERTAVEEYWFDVSGTNFPDDFPHVALGMVWGGKGVFETWFSADIDCIHGINWLPFTPASLYMGRHPDYVKINHDRIVSIRKGGRDYNNGWGDLVCMFNALQDPDSAAAFLDEQPACKIEPGNTHAFMYHWIHTLKNLGRVDPSVTANHPLFAVFTKNGQRTHVAYNGNAEPLQVTFSDGTALMASPHTLTVQ